MYTLQDFRRCSPCLTQEGRKITMMQFWQPLTSDVRGSKQTANSKIPVTTNYFSWIISLTSLHWDRQRNPAELKLTQLVLRPCSKDCSEFGSVRWMRWINSLFPFALDHSSKAHVWRCKVYVSLKLTRWLKCVRRASLPDCSCVHVDRVLVYVACVQGLAKARLWENQRLIICTADGKMFASAVNYLQEAIGP